MNAHVDEVHTMVEPISLNLDVRRSLPPLHTDLGYDITGKLHTVKVANTYFIPLIVITSETYWEEIY